MRPLSKPIAVAALAAAALCGALLPFGTPPESVNASAAFTESQHASAVFLTTSEWRATSPTALATGNTTVRLNWTAAEGHSTYRVERATNSGFTTGLVATNVSGTALNVSGLAQNTTYYFRVRGQANTSLPWSATASAQTGPGAPPAPKRLMTDVDVRDPHGIVVSGSNVWVADYNRGSILQVPQAGGTVTAVFDKKLPVKSIRQISTTHSATAIGVVINDINATAGWSEAKDGFYTVGTNGTSMVHRLANPKGYGLVYNAGKQRYYFNGANSAGEESRSLFECTTAFACTKIWDSPVMMRYMSMPSGSNELIIAAQDRVYNFNVATKEVDIVASLGGDIRGVHNAADNVYFFSDFTTGMIWRIAYTPSTGATSSKLLLSNRDQPRAMAITSGGALIVADTARAGSSGATGSLWSYAGLGK